MEEGDEEDEAIALVVVWVLGLGLGRAEMKGCWIEWSFANASRGDSSVICAGF